MTADAAAGDLLNGHRDGFTYEAAFDCDRLNHQQRAVYDVMRDGSWHTLGELANRLGFPEASVSARCRDLRKPRFGGFTVNRKRISRGLFAYQLQVRI